MPAGFEACQRKGGRIRRIVPKKGVYINVCYLDGKSYRGEVHHTKSNPSHLSRAIEGRK